MNDVNSKLKQAMALTEQDTTWRQARAWKRLEEALFEKPLERERVLRRMALALACVAFLGMVGAAAFFAVLCEPLLAQARQWGLDASTFYAPEARAHVIWISGLDSARDEGILP